MVKKEANKDNSLGVIAVTLGILGIVFVLMQPLISVVLGIVGIVLSRKQSKVHANKWSKAGLILNIIAVVLAVVLFIIFFVVISQLATSNPQLFAELQGI